MSSNDIQVGVRIVILGLGKEFIVFRPVLGFDVDRKPVVHGHHGLKVEVLLIDLRFELEDLVLVQRFGFLLFSAGPLSAFLVESFLGFRDEIVEGF